MQTVLDGLPDSYHSFASTLRLLMKGNLNAINFEELMAILLQEENSRQNRSNICVANESFMAGQRGKSKAFTNNKPKLAPYNSNKLRTVQN